MWFNYSLIFLPLQVEYATIDPFKKAGAPSEKAGETQPPSTPTNEKTGTATSVIQSNPPTPQAGKEGAIVACKNILILTYL